MIIFGLNAFEDNRYDTIGVCSYLQNFTCKNFIDILLTLIAALFSIKIQLFRLSFILPFDIIYLYIITYIFIYS